jgi:hypothetical protein
MFRINNLPTTVDLLTSSWNSWNNSSALTSIIERTKSGESSGNASAVAKSRHRYSLILAEACLHADRCVLAVVRCCRGLFSYRCQPNGTTRYAQLRAVTHHLPSVWQTSPPSTKPPSPTPQAAVTIAPPAALAPAPVPASAPVSASGEPRGELLGSISSFSKTGLKKAETNDRSGPDL